MIAFLENNARSLLFATGLPPASVAAAAAALRIMRDDAALVHEAARKRAAVHFRAGARAGPKPDRACDRGRGPGSAGGFGDAGGERIPGRRDPPAERAARHSPAAVRVFGVARAARYRARRALLKQHATRL